LDTVRMAVKLSTALEVREYVLGGHATVTFVSTKTKTHLTYRVTVCKRDARFHFVWVHTSRGYRYVGAIRGVGDFKSRSYFVPTKKSLPETHQYFKSFKWIWGHIYNDSLPSNMQVFHYGTCCRCGRTLTDPKSIELGIGPECIKHT